MKDRNPIADAVSTIAWAFVILHLDFNIGRLNLLGNWIGYWMIADAVAKLAKERPESGLLRPLAVGLAVWDGICNALWLFLGLTVNIFALIIVEVVLMLYLRFQLLTNLADIAGAHRCPQQRSLLVLRTVQTLLLTAAMLLPEFKTGIWSHTLSLNWNPINFFIYLPEVVTTYGTIAVNMAVAVWVCVVLFSLRRSLGWKPPPRSEPPKPEEFPPLNLL